MNRDQIATLVAFLFLIFTVLYFTYRDKELVNTKVEAKAKVIDYYKAGGKYYLKYSFRVKNKKYVSECNVYPFKCENGVDGCIGEEFKIIYSRLDPSNNDINLGRYNTYKRGKRIYKFINLNKN